MGGRFNPKKESHYLMYLNANNLYGWAMSKSLLTGGLRWVKNPEKLCISKLAKNQSKGYLLEADFFNLMNNLVFGKMMEKIRKLRDIKLVMNKKAYLVSNMAKADLTMSTNLMAFTSFFWYFLVSAIAMPLTLAPAREKVPRGILT